MTIQRHRRHWNKTQNKDGKKNEKGKNTTQKTKMMSNVQPR
jgi:hypothetical protein